MYAASGCLVIRAFQFETAVIARPVMIRFGSSLGLHMLKVVLRRTQLPHFEVCWRMNGIGVSILLIDALLIDAFLL